MPMTAQGTRLEDFSMPLPAGGPEFRPLSLAQRGVWLDTVSRDNRAAYVLGSIAHVGAPLDADIARQALRLLIARHEALRLRIDRAEPRQWLGPVDPLPFALHDVSDAAEPDAASTAALRAITDAGFALGDEAPFRLDLFRLGATDWRVVLLCHHLVGDGISISLAQRHWLDIYIALSGEAIASDEDTDAGTPAALTAKSAYLPIVASDEAYETSRRFAEDIAHFCDRLADLPPPLFADLPREGTVGPVAAVPAVAPLILEEARFATFANVAEGAGLTVAGALSALTAVALARRYGREDFVLGLALHGRDFSTRNVIGMLAGVIALRCRLDNEASLLASAKSLAAATEADMRHARAPLDAVGRAIARGDRARRLNDVVLTLLPAFEEHASRLGGVAVTTEPVRLKEETPLVLTGCETAGGFRLDFNHDENVLTRLEVTRFSAVLAQVIEHFITRPQVRLGAIAALTAEETSLLDEASYGPYVALAPTTLPAAFAAAVAATPDALAVTAADGALSFGELDGAANALAHRLIAAGIAPGEAVGVLMPRSLPSPLAALAVLKAGGVYLPLDPDYPPMRLANMVEDAAARLVLCTAATAALAPAGVPSLMISDEVLTERRADAPAPAVSPEDAAYIIFTSGSTGRPKGVAVPHRAALNLATARQAYDPVGPGDVVLACVSISFDVSFGQIVLPLIAGAAVAVIGDLRATEPNAFWEFLRRHKVTSAASGPSVIEAMLSAEPGPTALKRLICGGERFPAALAARLREALPGCRLVNAYGPTEAAIETTVHVLADGETDPLLPIGRPLANCSVHILDRRLETVGVGHVGELCIGGEGLAIGYIGDPERTAEKFVDHPSFGRLYRSGDHASWREDGTIAFLGRADHQVKIRGFRIETGEIEAALAEHPAVARAIVAARPSRRGDLILIAWVLPEAGAPAPSAATLADHLAGLLPRHMLPSAFVAIGEIPLTANAKIDVAALPDPDFGLDAGAPPATPTEKALAALIEELLGVEGVTLDDDFFALGGHSLLATRLAVRLRDRFAVNLPLTRLFSTPRLGELAAAIDDLRANGAGVAGLKLAAGPRPDRLPLAFAQERLWFLYQCDPSSAAYNIAEALRVRGSLDADRLKTAFTRIAARHEILRTRFLTINGVTEQWIDEPAPVRFTIEPVAEADLASVARLEAERPFDLVAGPLWRVRVLKLGADDHVILLTLHHIIADGWSVGVLMRDLSAFYTSESETALPPLEVHYADYALWQRSWLTGDLAATQLAYWREALDELPDQIALPIDSQRPETTMGAGESLPLALSSEVSARVRAFAREAGTTPFVVILSAFAAVLRHWSGQDDFAIGVPVANRRDAASEELIGFFVNSLALRARFAEDMSFSALVKSLHATALAAFDHQDLPFERVVEALCPTRDLSRHPLFQVMFVMQNLPAATTALPGLVCEPLHTVETLAKFDLTLVLDDSATGFAGQWVYAAGLFARQTMAAMARAFCEILAGLTVEPATRIDAIEWLTAAGQAEITGPWAGFTAPYERLPIPTLFEDIAARHGGQPAVRARDGELTYAGLDARANRLARALLADGHRPGSAVGVLLPRGLDSVAAPLGVLKAGGIYLPIDPAYPDERIADMLAQAAAKRVVTTASLAKRLPTTIGALLIENLDAAGGDDTGPSLELSPEETAYLIFTSGSTGVPKAVAMPHGAFANLAAARRAYDPIEPGDVVLASLSVGFDVAVGQLLAPLLAGATVFVSEALDSLTGAEFWRLMRDEGVTSLNSGASYIEAVLAEAPKGLALKRLMLGGEPLTTALARRIRAALPGVELFNIYGPTETCIDATSYRVSGEETGAAVPMGRPHANYRVYVLDGTGRPVAPGITGELHIGGASLASGYHGDARLTAARFIDHADFGRLYRTGDLVRWTADGELMFIGRSDHQVKIRGFRIELGEIEAVLKSHPAIEGAAVIVRKLAGTPTILAYVVARDGTAAPLDTAGILAHLKARLPDYMLPRAITVLPALPVTAHAKLDVRALPDPVITGARRAAVPPRDATDARLLAVWREVLSAPDLGIDDNFFEAGGHSLLALRLLAELKEVAGRDLPVTMLFKCQTVRMLADTLAETPTGEARAEAAGPLHRLSLGRAGAPLYCVHPVGGSSIVYRALAEALGATVDVYGLDARGLDEAGPLARDLTEMAADYVAAIRRRQPRGPYRLLGHSFGGQVAFEMARLLTEAGEAVESLILLDTSRPLGVIDSEAQDLVVLAHLKAARSELAAVLGTLPPGLFDRLEKLMRNNMRIAELHRPTPLRASVHYVAAEREDDRRADFWCSRGTGTSHGAAIGCDHYAMLDGENAARLAEVIRPWLRC